MRKIFTGALLLLATAAAQAQFTYDYLKAADNYFTRGDYASAAEYYERYLSGGKAKGGSNAYNPYVVQASSKKSVTTPGSRPEAIYRLAESYRQLNYPAKAEPNYKFLVETEAARFPLARYHQAESLRALEKFAEAEQAFTTFLDQYQTADANTEAAKREVANLRFIQQELKKKDLNLYKLAKSDMNGSGATYAPVWAGGQLYLTSTRPDSAAGRKTYVNRIYQSAGGSLSPVGLPQVGDLHQGAPSFSADGNTVYYTIWGTNNDQKAAIYRSTREGSGWSAPQALTAVNAAGFNSKQPFLMPGGRQLLFASDMGGGQGGYDLWLADLDAQGMASAPTNLGSVINTHSDDEAPFYHEPSATLVFSTKGRVGMGGFDLFQSKGKPGAWSEPQNMGYPVNYVKDDIYFTSRGSAKNLLEDVLFSSDRQAACCLEMFALSKTIPVRQVSGLVVACETNTPLAGATIRVVDETTNATVFSRTVGADGRYSFTLEEFRPLKAMATAEGYHPNTLQFSNPSDPESLSLGNPALCLTLIPKAGTTEVLENVYYAFNKAELLDESHAALNKLVELMNRNPAMRIEIGGHTDDRGNDAYNQKLSEARAQSVVDYLVSQGVDAGRIESKGYGETMPIAPNRKSDGSDDPEGRKKNRRTEFKVLSNG